MLHDTKRAHADARRQQHREEHKQTGQMCEHGVVSRQGVHLPEPAHALSMGRKGLHQRATCRQSPGANRARARLAPT